MEKKSITLSQTRVILGLTDQSIRALIKRDPSFPAYKIDGGHFRVIESELYAWIERQRTKRHASWKAACAAKGAGSYELSDAVAEADANDDIRYILKNGCEPAGRYWRNASQLFGAAPADIAIGVGLAPGVSWARVVEKIEQLLELPREKKQAALAFINDRRTKFFETAADPLALDPELA